MSLSSAPRDSDIRVALKAWLAATAGPDDYLIEELGLERGQGRVDLNASPSRCRRLPRRSIWGSAGNRRQSVIVRPNILADSASRSAAASLQRTSLSSSNSIPLAPSVDLIAQSAAQQNSIAFGRVLHIDGTSEMLG